MPMLLGILVIIAAVYQLFFRYETWPSAEKPGVRYEHDNLTGDTRLLKPGAKMNVFARILGSGGGDGDSEKSHFLTPFTQESQQNAPLEGVTEDSLKDKNAATNQNIDLHDTQQVATVAQPVPVPRQVVVASSAPPVPGGNVMLATAEEPPFAVRQVDLDDDGFKEEIIQNSGKSDGLLDISIVKNGREIFFGRGQQIALLPTRSLGWSDIALKQGGKNMQVYRYDSHSAAYRALK